MTQRMALIFAGALTAFVFVLMAGVGLTVALKPSATTSVLAQSEAPVTNPVMPQQASASNALVAKLSPDQAARIALSVAPEGKLARVPELVSFQGAVAYEVALNQGNVYVDANSGNVLFNGITTNTAAPAPIRGRERHEGTNNQEHEGDHND